MILDLEVKMKPILLAMIFIVTPAIAATSGYLHGHDTARATEEVPAEDMPNNVIAASAAPTQKFDDLVDDRDRIGADGLTNKQRVLLEIMRIDAQKQAEESRQFREDQRAMELRNQIQQVQIQQVQMQRSIEPTHCNSTRYGDSVYTDCY